MGLAAISGVFSLGSFSVNYLPSARVLGVHGYYQYVTSIASGVPLFFVSPGDAVPLSGTQVGAVGASIGLRVGKNQNSALTPYWQDVENTSVHIGLYQTYATYRDARLQGSSAAWNDDWHPATASEMIAAPFHARNVGRPIVLVPLIIGASFSAIVAATAYARDDAARPGPATRDALLGVGLGFEAGVTEEALFRGVIFEELRLSLGRWPASLLDSAAFSAFHVPGELGVLTQSQILTGLVTRFGFSLIAEEAYVEGGLPASVAFHTLWDTTLFLGNALSGTNPLGSLVSPVAPSEKKPSPARPLHAPSPRDQVTFPLLSGSF